MPQGGAANPRARQHGRGRERRTRDTRTSDTGVQEHGWDAVRIHHAASDRLVGARGRPGHGERDLVGGRGDGRHEEHEHRVDAAVSQQDGSAAS